MQYANGTTVKEQSTKIKSCKLCSKKRWANTSYCYGDMKMLQRKKREEKAKARLERVQKSKKFQKSERKKWQRKAWAVFSQWIRRRSADWKGFVKCYTCPTTRHYKEMDAGHLFHGKLDFEPLNIHPQCDACNRRHSGRREEYSANLIQEIGQERFLELRRQANTKIYSLEDLKEIFTKYQGLLNNL